MSPSAWSPRRSAASARAHNVWSHRVWKPALAVLAALGGGACDSSDTPGEPAAEGGSGGSEMVRGGSGGGDGSVGAAAGSGKAGGGGAAAAAGQSGGSAGAAAGSGGAKQSPSALYGTFTLSLNTAREASAGSEATEARTSFLGLVSDGEKPSPNAWTEDMKANGCTLFLPSSPLCDPACGSSAACVAENTCAPYPKSLSVGAITLKGVGDRPVEMTPIGANNNYQPKAGTSLPYPACAEGDQLSLSVEGGAYSSFELQTKCIAPLDFQGPIKLDKGVPLKLSWGAPGDAKLARLQVRLNISHHGGTRGEVRCEVDDNGSLELPATMVDRLLDLGVAGFPTIILTRVSTGSASGDGPANVEFIVQQYVEREIVIAGLESCNENTACPAGKTCDNSDLTCK